MESLKEVRECLNNIASVSSTKEKSLLIKEYLNVKNFARVVYYALNPFMKYNMTHIKPSFFVTKHPSVDIIFSLLDTFQNQNGASSNDRSALSKVCSFDRATLDVVNRIVSKDLKCGASIKTFKKYIPEIPLHIPALCIDDRDKFFKHAKTIDNVCWSLKLDGVRIWAIIDNKNKSIKYISRKGILYKNFGVFNDELLKISEELNYTLNKLTKHTIILDGEVTTTEKNFQKQMQDIRRIYDADSSKFIFNVFDIVDTNPNFLFFDRYNSIVETISDGYDKIKYVKHDNVISKEKVDFILEEVTNAGEEGIVLKTWNGKYTMDRSKEWCKCKLFREDDFEVTGWEYGTGKNSKKMGKLIIKLKDGTTNKVGSGFSDKQRLDFMTETPTMITVKFQGYTDEGKLRFPTFVCVRDDK